MTDKNCLSYWYPIIKNVPGVRTPETLILDLGDEGWSLAELLDGRVPEAATTARAFVRDAGESLGYPMFVRTGHGSGKHNWSRTCCVREQAAIPRHIAALVEWSHMVDMLGLPHSVWVARRMLAVHPLFRCTNYGDMPVVEEWRVFVRDGAVECVHPYWPTEAIEQGAPDLPDWRRYLTLLHRVPPPEVVEMARLAAAALGGYWSADVMFTNDGYYLTDMAIGERSYHWPGCKSLRGMQDAADAQRQ